MKKSYGFSQLRTSPKTGSGLIPSQSDGQEWGRVKFLRRTSKYCCQEKGGGCEETVSIFCTGLKSIFMCVLCIQLEDL